VELCSVVLVMEPKSIFTLMMITVEDKPGLLDIWEIMFTTSLLVVELKVVEFTLVALVMVKRLICGLKMMVVRQRWLITPTGKWGEYNIRAAGGVGNRSFLSCNENGKVDLWTQDDGSGRQRWMLNAKSFVQENRGHNIYAAGGTSTSRTMFSCPEDGQKVDLWTNDDNSGRQVWTFKHLGNNVYNIYVAGGTKDGRNMLSCVEDGTKVDLWKVDDNSGRQKWVLIPVSGGKANTFNIRAAGGMKGDRVWLSCQGDGGVVDLWKQDDGSGRQRWVINPK